MREGRRSQVTAGNFEKKKKLARMREEINDLRQVCRCPKTLDELQQAITRIFASAEEDCLAKRGRVVLKIREREREREKGELSPNALRKESPFLSLSLSLSLPQSLHTTPLIIVVADLQRDRGRRRK